MGKHTQTRTTCTSRRFVKDSDLNLLDNLNNVLIIQNMVSANLLRLMFHACSPNQRILELLHDTLMYSVAEVLYRPPVLR